MAEPLVLNALIRKYAELSGLHVHCNKEAVRLRHEITCLEATIKLFKKDCDFSAIAPIRAYRRNSAVRRGAFIRDTLTILREATQPMSARELATMALRRQGFHNPEYRDIEELRRMLNANLLTRSKKGNVVVCTDGHPKLWSIVKLP